MEVLDNIEVSWDRFVEIVNSFTSRDLFEGEQDMRPILKC
jgi:hypothetical protein